MSPQILAASWRAALPLSSSLLSSNRCAPPLRHLRNWHRPRYSGPMPRASSKSAPSRPDPQPASGERACPVLPVRVSARQCSDVPDARVCLARAAASLCRTNRLRRFDRGHSFARCADVCGPSTPSGFKTSSRRTSRRSRIMSIPALRAFPLISRCSTCRRRLV